MKYVCVIGLGQFGMHLARTLAESGCQVLAVDAEEQPVTDIRDHVQQAVIADARNLSALESVVSNDTDEAIVCLGESLEASILATLHVSKLGIETIRAKASSAEHAAILRAIGATETIFPERETAERLAQRIINPDLLDYLPLSPEYHVVEIEMPDKFVGQTLAGLHLRKKYGVLAIAIKGAGQDQFDFLPEAETVLERGRTLVLLGRNEDLKQFSDSV